MVDSVTSKLILGFVILLLGAALIGTIATQGLGITEKTRTSNEVHTFAAGISGSVNPATTYRVTNYPTGWKLVGSDACPLTSVVLTNSTGTPVWTLNTDYLLYAQNGSYKLLNTSQTTKIMHTDNKTYVSYTWCGDDYLNLSWGRTGIDLVAGLFAIALLLSAVGLFYSVAKDTGMLG